MIERPCLITRSGRASPPDAATSTVQSENKTSPSPRPVCAFHDPTGEQAATKGTAPSWIAAVAPRTIPMATTPCSSAMDASSTAAPSCISPQWNPRREGLPFGKNTSIGRTPDNDIPVGDETVSKHHARVVVEDGRYWFWDLASANHSYLRLADGTSKRIREPHELADGDTLDLGEVRMTYIEVDLGEVR